MPMNAIATLLYTPAYLPGAIVLGYTLRKLAPDARLVCLIDKLAFSQFHLEILGHLWDELQDTLVLESTLTSKLVDDLRRPELAKTFTKVHLWALPYDKVLYLDADTLPLLGSTGLITDLLKIDVPEGHILAAPDSGFPDIFNSGVFVLRPSSTDHENLVGLAVSGDESVSFDGADQGLLNQYFNPDPDWVAQAVSSGEILRPQLALKWIPIPFFYNTTPNAQYQYLPASNHFGLSPLGGAEPKAAGAAAPSPILKIELSPYNDTALAHFIDPRTKSRVKLLHFIGPNKPWLDPTSAISKHWWDDWNEYSGGRLLEACLFPKEYPVSIKKLYAPGTAPPPSFKTPAELCDPLNYEHFVSYYAPGTKAWDATKEAPPTAKAPASKFPDDLKSYSSLLDSFQATSITPAKPRKKRVVKDLDPAFGVHDSQVAERVFDESYDYRPQHVLMRIRDEQVDEMVAGVAVDEEEEEVLEEIEERDDDELAAPSEYASQENMLAVFPWENRRNVAERVWE